MYRRLNNRSPSPDSSSNRLQLKINPVTHSHMNQRSKRTLASPARIWALLASLIALFLLTRSWLYPTVVPAHSFYNRDALFPKNYLNESVANPAPFQFCPVNGPGDPMGQKYGAHVIAKSRLHVGSNARIQKVIHKAMSGQPITISVLGGSIASCHGAGDDPLAPNCWPTRFFMWWNEVFPHPASQLTNGARKRTNSAYYSFCHAHHLPDETDLVILDFDTDDDAADSQILDHFEMLVRSILIRQDTPALLLLGHFSPQLQDRFAFQGPELAHMIVAQFYDIPHISIKGPVYSDYLSNPEEFKTTYFVDPILANTKGHELLSDMLIAYFQTQVCSGWSSALGYSFDVPFLSNDNAAATDAKGLFGGIRHAVEDEHANVFNGKDGVGFSNGPFSAFRVPPARLSSRPHELAKFQEVEPFCAAADDLINPLPPSLFSGSGWHSHHPGKDAVGDDENRHYWYSTLPTSKLRVPIKVGMGDIAIYYLEESKEDPNAGSSVECWVDDNYGGKFRINNWAPGTGSRPRTVMIDHYVKRGSHFVECALLGEEGYAVEPFKILGIFAT